MGDFPFATQDVLALLGISCSNGSGMYMKCPYCNSKHKPLHWDFKRSLFRCNKNPDHHGNILTFYADQMGMASTKDAYSDILERLKLGDVVTTVKCNTSSEENVEATVADINTRHKVYSIMLQKSYLSKKNKEDLLQRGFTEEEINEIGYKTMPDRTMNEIFDFINSLNLNDFTGVPGFYTTQNDNWYMKTWKRGIIVPYLDINGNIQSIQIRKDNDVREKDEDGNLDSKYYYFTSRGKKNGSATSQCVHFACDFIERDGEKIINIKNGVMVLTEGAMKGELYHRISGMPTMAVPGVHCLDALKKVLPKIKELGVYRIILGYDMDRVMNIDVMEALYKMKALILSYGFECPLLEWSNEVVLFNGNHEIMDCDTTFVVTPESLKDMQERDKLEDTLKRAIRLDIDNVLYAFKNKETAIKSKDTYKIIQDACNALGIPCKPCFWKLNLKGIDDKYAYEQRGIIPQ